MFNENNIVSRKSFFIFLTVVFLFIFIQIKLQNNSYKQLTPYVLLKTNSVQKENENTINAWFKIINQEENKIKYDEINYKAFCDTENLYIIQSKSYENNKLITNDKNKSTVSSHYSATVNGEIIYKTLCSQQPNS